MDRRSVSEGRGRALGSHDEEAAFPRSIQMISEGDFYSADHPERSILGGLPHEKCFF